MSVGVLETLATSARAPCAMSVGRVLLLALLPALLLDPARAAAAPPRERVAPRVELYAGAHYALGLGDVCQRDADVVACSTGESFLGAHALVLYRPFDHWSFGPSVAFGVRPGGASTSAGSFDSELSLLRVTAEARYWPSKHRRLGLYLAAEAGLASMNEQLSVGETSAETELPSRSSVSQAAPLLGAGLGLGIALPFGLGVVPSVRGFATFFSDDPDGFSTDLDAHSFGTLYWVALCVDATFGFGL